MKYISKIISIDTTTKKKTCPETKMTQRSDKNDEDIEEVDSAD